MSDLKNIKSELLREVEPIAKRLLALHSVEKRDHVQIRELFHKLNYLRQTLDTLNYLELEIAKSKITDISEYMVISHDV